MILLVIRNFTDCVPHRKLIFVEIGRKGSSVSEWQRHVTRRK